MCTGHWVHRWRLPLVLGPKLWHFHPHCWDFQGPAGYLFVLLSTFPVTTNLCPVFFFFFCPCQLSHGLKTVWATTDADACSRGLRVERKRAWERGVIDPEAARDTFTPVFKTNTCCRGWSAGGTSEILQSVTARLWLDNETELIELQHYSFISSPQLWIRYPAPAQGSTHVKLAARAVVEGKHT